MRANPAYYMVYYLILVFFGAYCLLNLMVGVVFQAFAEEKSAQKKGRKIKRKGMQKVINVEMNSTNTQNKEEKDPGKPEKQISISNDQKENKVSDSNNVSKNQNDSQQNQNDDQQNQIDAELNKTAVQQNRTDSQQNKNDEQQNSNLANNERKPLKSALKRRGLPNSKNSVHPSKTNENNNPELQGEGHGDALTVENLHKLNVQIHSPTPRNSLDNNPNNSLPLSQMNSENLNNALNNVIASENPSNTTSSTRFMTDPNDGENQRPGTSGGDSSFGSWNGEEQTVISRF